jgi:2-hydroxy-3-keto-5-methylthiopentenyl-1-phosphate phosphatase
MRIFCDFDGTVAENDVGNLIFQTFADGHWREAVEEWLAGRISSKECLIRECKASALTREALVELVDEQRLDPGFDEFVLFCRQHAIPLMILSDGLDFYVERILTNFGLDDIPARANHLVFAENNAIVPEFPYERFSCGRCANCKGHHLRAARTAGEWLVYIGDGYSDRCAAVEADLIFAKRDLRRYCREEGVPYVDFETFDDVLEGLRAFVGERVPVQGV